MHSLLNLGLLNMRFQETQESSFAQSDTVQCLQCSFTLLDALCAVCNTVPHQQSSLWDKGMKFSVSYMLFQAVCLHIVSFRVRSSLFASLAIVMYSKDVLYVIVQQTLTLWSP